MKDFRDKIKGYKAEPNDKAWERMLVKKEKKGLKKYKNFLFALIGLNCIILGVLAFSFFEKDAGNKYTQTEKNTNNNESKTSLIQDNNEIAKYQRTISEWKGLYQEQLNENSKILEDLTQLRANYQSSQNRISSPTRSNLSSQNNYTSLSTVNSTEVLFPISNMIASTPGVGAKSLETNDNNVEVSSNLNLLQISSIAGIPIERSLINFALSVKPNATLPLSKITIKKAKPSLWMISAGTSVENNVSDGQGNFNFGFFRRLNKSFEAGLLFDFSKIQEKNEYNFFNEIKDHRIETIVLFAGRYNALKFRKFIFHLDAGVGYRFGSISERQFQIVDNQINFYHESSPFQGIAYHLALGSMYNLSPNLGVGLRLYLDNNLHTNLNVLYRF